MKTDDGRDGVLVLDSDSQCGLCVIRSLGRKDVTVTAGGHSSRSLGMFSLASDESYVHPDPGRDYDAFIDHLVGHIEENDYFAVIPVEDHTTLLLARNKAEIEAAGTLVATEDRETFNLAFDKGAFFQHIESIDVPAPTTYTPERPEAIDQLAAQVEYPVVIKPRSKSRLSADEYTRTIITDDNYVESPEELRQTYRRIVSQHTHLHGGPPLIQEYIPGHTTTTVTLADAGEILTYFQEERLRTYPSSGGNSALLGAVREPKMLDYARRVLGHLDWTGPAMVEFKQRPDGEFVVIEVNGRYWGSLPFAITCGVDVPWLHYLQLKGIDPAPLVDFGAYRTDIVQRRLLYEDIKWLGENVVDGNVGALIPFLGAFGGTRHTFVDLADPVPTAWALLKAARLGGGAALRRAVGGVQ